MKKSLTMYPLEFMAVVGDALVRKTELDLVAYILGCAGFEPLDDGETIIVNHDGKKYIITRAE